MKNKTCRVCGELLNSDNWYLSQHKNSNYICKECSAENARLYQKDNRDEISAQQHLYYKENKDKINVYIREWRKNNPEKAKAYYTRANRKKGMLSFDENKECTVYYGVHINEGVIKLYFNDVEMMPMNHPDYDFICKNGWKIDGKSSFTGDKGHWAFTIKHNTTADYFFCVAYDNRKDKNILHIWLLPGNKFNHLSRTGISKSTIDKWSEYEQPVDKIIACCDIMKGE